MLQYTCDQQKASSSQFGPVQPTRVTAWLGAAPSHHAAGELEDMLAGTEAEEAELHQAVLQLNSNLLQREVNRSPTYPVRWGWLFLLYCG